MTASGLKKSLVHQEKVCRELFGDDYPSWQKSAKMEYLGLCRMFDDPNISKIALQRAILIHLDLFKKEEIIITEEDEKSYREIIRMCEEKRK